MDKAVNGITEGPVRRNILRYFFPVLAGTFFQQLYNTVDAIIVGRFAGAEALAAVGGTTGILLNLTVGFFLGLTGGASVVIAQRFGARDEEGTSVAVHTSFAFSIAGGIVLALLGMLLPLALPLMNTPEDVMQGATTYLRVCFAGLVPALLGNMGQSALQAIGDSRRPFFIMVMSCCLNIALDLLFVAVFRWGVAGVAWATVIAEAAGAVVVVWILLRARGCYRLIPRRIRFHRETLREVIRIGIPTGLQTVLTSASGLYIQSSINIFGTDIMAGWTVSCKTDSLVWTVFSAFSQTIATFSGQNLGAGKPKRVRRAMRECGAMALAFGVAFSLAMIAFGRGIMGLFTSDASVVDAGMRLMRCMYFFYAAYVPTEIILGALRGAGDTLWPTAIKAIGMCALRVAWIAVCRALGTDIESVIWSYSASWVLTSLAMIIYFRHSKLARTYTATGSEE